MKRIDWSTLRQLPLLGPLADCAASDHLESLGQLVIVTTLSMAPIWLGALILFGMGADLTAGSFTAALRSEVANGELFMYSTALLAPVFWMALFDPPGARAFPSKVPHMFFIGIIDLIAAAFFGLITAHQMLNPLFVFWASMCMFVASLVLLYLGTVYHISRLPDAADVFRREEDDFSAAVGDHHQ